MLQRSGPFTGQGWVVGTSQASVGCFVNTRRHKDALVNFDWLCIKDRLGGNLTPRSAWISSIEGIIDFATLTGFESNKCSRFQITGRLICAGRIYKLLFHERHPLRQPGFHVVHLALIRAAVCASGPPIPFRQIPLLGLFQFIGHPVDDGVDVGLAELRTAKRLEPVDIFLKKIDVLEHTVPPRVVKKIGAPITGGRTPCSGIIIPSIRRAEGSVKIPNGAKYQFAAAGFVHVTTEPQRIDVEGHDVEQVMVYCCVNIDVFCIAPGRVLEIRSVQRIAHLVEKPPGILLLGVTFGSLNLHFLWINILYVLPAGAEAGITRVGTIDLKDITAGNFGFLLVLIE